MLPFCSHPFHAVQLSSPGAPAVCMRPARSRMRLVLLGDALCHISPANPLQVPNCVFVAQLFFSRACPLFACGLPAGARLLALGDVLYYLSAAVCAPVALAVPAATVALHGTFPLLLTWQWVAAAAPYLALTLAGAPQTLLVKKDCTDSFGQQDGLCI